jgi:hypothetical protein
MNVQVDAWRARFQALHEQNQVAPAEEGAVIFGGVDPWQLLPERFLPECQFPVVQIGWRVDDNLQHTAVVSHDGHGVTTKIIEGGRDDSDLAAGGALPARNAPLRASACPLAALRPGPTYGQPVGRPVSLAATVDQCQHALHVRDAWLADDIARDAELFGLGEQLPCHLLMTADEKERRARDVLH